MNKIGVYICHCGKNIASKIDIDKVINEFEADKRLVVKDHVFLCSEQGQKLIQSDVEKRKLDRVVIAACSPKHHEHIFSRRCQFNNL